MDTCLLQIILLNNKNDLFVQKIIHGDFYAPFVPEQQKFCCAAKAAGGRLTNKRGAKLFNKDRTSPRKSNSGKSADFPELQI